MYFYTCSIERSQTTKIGTYGCWMRGNSFWGRYFSQVKQLCLKLRFKKPIFLVFTAFRLEIIISKNRNGSWKIWTWKTNSWDTFTYFSRVSLSDLLPFWLCDMAKSGFFSKKIPIEFTRLVRRHCGSIAGMCRTLWRVECHFQRVSHVVTSHNAIVLQFRPFFEHHNWEILTIHTMPIRPKS